MKIALVYDRINKWGGAERVLVAFKHLFPTADWYTSFFEPNSASFAKDWKIKTSFLNRIRFLRTRHELVPYLMPFIFEGFDFANYDLVISISSEAAKGVIVKPGTYHINYCLTPTRYLYSSKDTYLNNILFRQVARPLRAWDAVAAQKPDSMIAISTHVKNEIKKYYRRDADIIFPPVDIEKFNSVTVSPSHRVAKPYYLVVSRLVPHKQIEDVIKAFHHLPDHHLIIIGKGKLETKLRKLAPSNVSFLKDLADQALVGYYSQAKALIHPCIEDFGLVMVEAMSCGTPILAKRGGGALDIVADRKTGMLYDDSSPMAIAKAVRAFDKTSFSADLCRQQARKFDIHIWEKQIMERVAKYVK